MVGVPRLARWRLRAVGADRLALALPPPQVGDEPRAEQQPDRQRGRGRRAGAEADVADEVEEPGKAELFGDQVEHQAGSSVSRSTTRARPTEFDALTSTASPGRSIRSTASAASSASSARVTCTPSVERFARAGAFPRRPGPARRPWRRRSDGARPAWSVVAVRAELAHRAEHRDPPLDAAFAAEALDRRRHRRRIGVVAFVDHQRLAAADRDPVALAAALQPAKVGQRQRRRRATSAPSASTVGQHRQRVRHPMVAALGDGEGRPRAPAARR